MIVTKIESLVDYIRNDMRIRIFKTMQDPITMKEVLECEVYTKKGVVEKMPEVGNEVDKKV